MRLNSIPTKTTNSFGVNALDIKIDIPLFNLEKFDGVVLNKKLNSRLGLEVNKYLNKDIKINEYENHEPILLEYNLDNDNIVQKINIEALKNSNLVMTIVFRGTGFNYIVIDGNIGENSNIKLNIINLLDKESTNLISINNKIYENACMTTSIIDFEGKLKISNYYSELIGNNSKDYLYSTYYGKNKDIIDINYDIKNIGKNTISNIETVGLLDDYSTKTMKMSIDFVSGSSKSIGEEQEKCILLSDTAISKSVPLLLCTEEDVQGVHAVATGKLEEDKIFYIMSRGFSYKEAIKIIINGDLNNVINNIDIEKLKEEILNRLNELL